MSVIPVSHIVLHDSEDNIYLEKNPRLEKFTLFGWKLNGFEIDANDYLTAALRELKEETEKIDESWNIIYQGIQLNRGEANYHWESVIRHKRIDTGKYVIFDWRLFSYEINTGTWNQLIESMESIVKFSVQEILDIPEDAFFNKDKMIHNIYTVLNTKK